MEQDENNQQQAEEAQPGCLPKHYDTEKAPVWDIIRVEKDLNEAYEKDSETDLLRLLKDNSFLFADLYTRRYAIQPVFRELNFGAKLRCDFAWLNDNSSGPEWVLVEIERPKMPLFKTNGKPTAHFNAAIEQVKSWDRYFSQHHGEAKRIFGAVAKFRYVLVTGTVTEWQSEHAAQWRIHHLNTSKIEIRSMQTFFNSLEIIKKEPAEMWSFAEHPVTLPFTELEEYWKGYGYMDRWRMISE